MNIALCRVPQLWQYRDTGNPEIGTMSYSYRMTSRVIHSAQYYRQDTLRGFEQFGAMYVHNSDVNNPTRPGFEPSSSQF